MGVFAKIQPQVGKCIQPPSANDLFLYALFARVARTDNSNVEFSTHYDKSCNMIELVIPDDALPIFNQITGIQQGPKFRAYIDWLIGGRANTGTSIIDEDLVIAGNSASTSEQTLASATVPTNAGEGIRIKAWGTFNTNNQSKTVRLYYGSTVVAINDITLKSYGQTWKLEADIYKRGTMLQEGIGTGQVGAVSQSMLLTAPAEDDTSDVTIEVTGKTLTPTANNIVCHGLVVEAI